jgi:hypothetical protein
LDEEGSEGKEIVDRRNNEQTFVLGYFFFLGFGMGNSFTEILTNSLNHSLSSSLSSIKKLDFAPSYGGASCLP